MGRAHRPCLSIAESIGISELRGDPPTSAVQSVAKGGAQLEPEEIMSARTQERILLVDDNPMFRDALARRLRAAGYQVVVEETGERGFLSARDRARPIGWLYTRAALPRLVDGWIVADAYHDAHAHRPAVISATAEPRSTQDIVLAHPSPAAVMTALLRIIDREMSCGLPAGVAETKRAA
jgi:CheY-like chemotaxis protein